MRDELRHTSSAERGRGRGGPHRARRGAVRYGILTLLAERPMHGYELITELEARSGGRWRPSGGAIYPALDKLEAHGLIAATDVDDKRQFSITDDGRTALTDLRDSRPAPWDDTSGAERGDLRRRLAELSGQLRQIGRFGTPEQRDAATAIVDRAVRELYGVLATPPAPAE